MSDEGRYSSLGDERFRHNHGAPVGGRPPQTKDLAQHMLELAHRYRVKPAQGWQEDRWELEEGEAFGLGLCATAGCEGCDRGLISATRQENSSRGWFCGRCKPLSPRGRVDHAEWVAKRRARA